MTDKVQQPRWVSFEVLGSPFEQEVDTNYIGRDEKKAYRHRKRVSTDDKLPNWKAGPPPRDNGE